MKGSTSNYMRGTYFCNLGVYYTMTADYSLAMSYFESSVSTFSSQRESNEKMKANPLNMSTESVALNNLAALYGILGDFESATPIIM